MTKRSFKQILIVFYLTLIATSALSFNESTYDLDCERYNDFLRSALKEHLRELTVDEFNEKYRESLKRTMDELDPENNIFTTYDRLTSISLPTKEILENCSKIKAIGNAYFKRTNKRKSLAYLLGLNLHKFLRQLDPNSGYYNREELSALFDESNGNSKKLGFWWVFNNGIPQITKVFEVGPSKNILFTGDRILKVNNYDTRQISTNEFAKLFKSSPDTVSLEIIRDGGLKKVEVVKNTIPSIEWSIVNDDPAILYLIFHDFSQDISHRMNDAIFEASKKADIKGFILDVRNNGGGYFKEAMKIAHTFIENEKRLLTIVKRGGKKDFSERYRPKHKEKEIPIIILINH